MFLICNCNMWGKPNKLQLIYPIFSKTVQDLHQKSPGLHLTQRMLQLSKGLRIKTRLLQLAALLLAKLQVMDIVMDFFDGFLGQPCIVLCFYQLNICRDPIHTYIYIYTYMYNIYIYICIIYILILYIYINIILYIDIDIIWTSLESCVFHGYCSIFPLVFQVWSIRSCPKNDSRVCSDGSCLHDKLPRNGGKSFILGQTHILG